MSDIIDINVNKIVEEVTINVVDNVIQVNINNVGGGGGGGTQTLAQTLDLGNTTGGENISISNGDAIILDNGSMLKKGTIDAGNGGSKGISQICGVGYEHKWEAGRLYIMNDGGTTIREVSHNFTNLPTATDDVTKGFVQNTRWILDNGDVYVCTDPTEDAAVWELVNTGTTPTLQEVTDADNETTNEITLTSDTVPLNLGHNGVDVLTFTDNDVDVSLGFSGLGFSTATSGSGLGPTSVEFNQNNKQTYYRGSDILFKDSLTTNDLTINYPTSIVGTDKVQTFQDADGVIALLSDITGGGGVPYTGATQNVDLGEFELKAGQIELDITPTGTAGVAVTRWNDTLGISETTLKGGSVILKNGLDLVARVVNKVNPNTTLTKAAYQVVKVSGAQGQRLAIDLARANSDLNSADTLGVVTETINANQEGFILTVGQLEGINTTGSLQGETWADGDVLYLSPTTAGRMTNIKPNGSNGHIVIIGYVEHAHNTQGKIYVKIMNGWELDELHNVFIDTPTNNQGLIYESSTDLWKNKTIIEDAIVNGVTAVAPSQNAVFDALALKQAVLSYSPYKNVQTSQTVHTGTTLETPIFTATIPAGTFNSQDIIKVLFGINKTTSLAAYTLRLRLSTTNNPLGGTLIALYTGGTGTQSVIMTRNFNLNGGNLYGVSFPTTILTDQVATNVLSSTALNPSNQFFIHANISLANAGDSINISMLSIHN
jgi:nitrogen fixation protein